MKLPFQKFFQNLLHKQADIDLQSAYSGFSFGTFAGSRNSITANEAYSGWVFACVRAIAEECAKIDLRLFRTDKQGNKELVLDHAAIRSLDNVNDYFTRHMLFERLQSDKELKGNEYWYMQPKKNSGGELEIYPLISENCKPVLDPKNYVSFYEYRIDAKTYKIPLEQIIQFKNFNPASDVFGMSTLQAARIPVETDTYAKQYNKSYFENHGVPATVLEYPQSMPPEEIEKLKNQWNQEFAGVKQGYKTAVATDGLKITRLDMSHADMEFVEQRRFSRDEILAIFRVPKIIVGIMEDVNRASAEAAMFAFMQWTILPKMNSIVDTLNEFYLPLFGEDNLIFEVANKVPEDKSQTVEFFNAGINNGWLSPNDVRRALGLAELADGENLYLPFNLSAYTKPVESKSYIRIEPVRKSAGQLAEKITEKVFPILQKLEVDDKFEAAGLAKFNRATAREMAYEKKYIKQCNELWRGQKQRAIAALSSPKKTIKKVTEVLNPDYELSVTVDLFKKLNTIIYEQLGQAALDEIMADETFDITEPVVAELIKDRTQKFAGSITQTTTDEIREIVASGYEENLTIDEIASNIMQASTFGEARAETISRTEVSRASGESELEAWKQSGVVAKKQWWTAVDERVCPECDALHGEVFDLDDPFISADELTDLGEDDYFGGIDVALRHPNCRCKMLPVLENELAYIPPEKKQSDAEKLAQYLKLSL